MVRQFRRLSCFPAQPRVIWLFSSFIVTRADDWDRTSVGEPEKKHCHERRLSASSQDLLVSS